MVAGVSTLAFTLSGCQPDFSDYIAMDKSGESFSCADLVSRYESENDSLIYMYDVSKLERKGKHYFKQCREALDRRHHNTCISLLRDESVFMRNEISDVNRKFCSDEIAEARANKIREIRDSGKVLYSDDFDKVISKGFIQEKGSSKQYRVAEIVSVTAPEPILDNYFYRVQISFSSQDTLTFTLDSKETALKYIDYIKSSS